MPRRRSTAVQRLFRQAPRHNRCCDGFARDAIDVRPSAEVAEACSLGNRFELYYRLVVRCKRMQSRCLPTGLRPSRLATVTYTNCEGPIRMSDQPPPSPQISQAKKIEI